MSSLSSAYAREAIDFDDKFRLRAIARNRLKDAMDALRHRSRAQK